MRPIPRGLEVMDDVMADIMRKKSPAERLQMAFQMWRFARDMIRANIRREHPEYTDAELTQAVARRMMSRAIGSEYPTWS